MNGSAKLKQVYNAAVKLSLYVPYCRNRMYITFKLSIIVYFKTLTVFDRTNLIVLEKISLEK